MLVEATPFVASNPQRETIAASPRKDTEDYFTPGVLDAQLVLVEAFLWQVPRPGRQLNLDKAPANTA